MGFLYVSPYQKKSNTDLIKNSKHPDGFVRDPNKPTDLGCCFFLGSKHTINAYKIKT